MNKELRPQDGIYYGWYVTATAMFIAAVTLGSRSAFGVFVIPMSEAFDWSRTTISVAAGIGVLVNGLSQPLLGHLFDRYDSRKVILISLLMVGLGTAGLSLTFHYLFLVFLFSFVLSVAISGVSEGTLGPLLARWFVRRRTMVLGLLVAGGALGGLTLIPISAYLVDLFDWRVSWIALGAIITVLALPLGFIFLQNSPVQMGLQPDGDPMRPADEPSPTQKRGRFEVEHWWQSFRSRPIWNLSASFTICGVSVGAVTIHFVPYAEEQIGISPTMAGVIFGLMMGLSVLGGIGGSWLADRIGRKDVLACVYLIRGLAYVVLLAGLFTVERGITLPLIGSPGVASLWVFAALAGLSWIASVPVTTSLTADVYGLRTLATISGISLMCHQVGSFGSILLAGILYDATGSYFLPFAISGALLFPAALSAFVIDERKYSSRFQSVLAGASARD